MKKNLFKSFLLVFSLVFGLSACTSTTEEGKKADEPKAESAGGNVGQSAVKDDQSQKDVVKIAAGSKDHTTLVSAIKQAEYVDVLSNVGPFTVFAPTNDAFSKLPPGTLDGLMKPASKNDLRNILEYHVSLGVFKIDALKDGQIIGQANGDNITIAMKNGKPTVNGANILASIPASNGMVHVIDAVLLPPKKK